MSDLGAVAKTLGEDIYSNVRSSLGDDWDALTGEQKDSIKETAQLYMELQLRSKTGDDVAEKLQAVESTVKDWEVWGEFAVEKAFWEGIDKAASAFGTFLGAVARTALGA